MFCKNCGMTLSDGSAFCRHCGAATASPPTSGKLKIQMGGASAAPQDKPREAPTASARRAYCPHCGAPNPANASFCVSCGQRLRDVSPAPTYSSARKQSRGLKIGLIAAGCFVLLLGVILAYNLLTSGDKPDDRPQKSTGISESLRDPEVSTPTEETLPKLEDGQILSRGDMAAVFAYAQQIALAENLVGSYLYDMDGDNVCELILQTGHSMADAIFHFYSYYDDSLHSLGNISAGHSSLCVRDGMLIVHYGHMNYEQVTELTLQEKRLVSNCVLDRKLEYGEEYLKLSQKPYSAEGDDLSLLAHVYEKSEQQIVNTSALFTTIVTTGIDFFTDGAHGYAQLVDERVISVDAETGKVAVVATVDTESPLFAATKNRLFFRTDNYWSDGSTWWGENVFSYSVHGADYQLHAEGVTVQCDTGYILLTSYRSDISPKYVTLIDSDGTTLVSNVYAWDAAIYGGAVYYCGLDYDAFWESYNNSDPYTMSLYRVQGSSVHIADIFMGKSTWGAAIDAENARILVYNSDNTSTAYDLRTGKQIH